MNRGGGGEAGDLEPGRMWGAHGVGAVGACLAAQRVPVPPPPSTSWLPWVVSQQGHPGVRGFSAESAWLARPLLLVTIHPSPWSGTWISAATPGGADVLTVLTV